MSVGQHATGWFDRAFFDFKIDSNRLAIFRLAFFFVIGAGLLLQIGSASRFGINGFGVSQLPGLDFLFITPTRPLMLASLLLQAFLAFSIAFGRVTPLYCTTFAVLNGYTYFSSQLDSYQHHYLIFLLSALFAVGVHRRDDDQDFAPWAARLLMVTVAIVYFWAGIAKLDGDWLSGMASKQQLGNSTAKDILETVFGFLSETGRYKLVAWTVMLTEFSLAALLLFRPRSWLTVCLGVGLHIAIELTPVDIGLFSYLMFAFYLVCIPRLPSLIDRQLSRFRDRWQSMEHSVVIYVVALAASAVIFTLNFDAESLLFVFGLIVIAGSFMWQAPQNALIAALSLLAIVLVVERGDVEFEYYKNWGGVARRTGTLSDKQYVYRKLTEVAPEYGRGYFHLGRAIETRAEAAEGKEQDDLRNQALRLFDKAHRLKADDYQACQMAARVAHALAYSADVRKYSECFHRRKAADMRDKAAKAKGAIADSLLREAKLHEERADTIAAQ